MAAVLTDSDVHSLSGTTLAGDVPSSAAKSTASGYDWTSFVSHPAFYTVQPNLTTRARQLELWSARIMAYCEQHRIFRLALSSPPPDLFANAAIKRALKPADIRLVLDHISRPENGARIEWIPATMRAEASNSCYVYWKTLGEWADTIASWIDETGQKTTVLTLYEIREGEAVRRQPWADMDEAMLRKVLNVLVKRGRAQIFGNEDTAGVKFF